MITIKSEHAIKDMKAAGAIVYYAMREAAKAIVPGVSTKDIDHIAYDYIIKAGALPSFKGYDGFPGTLCISLNDEVVHGIPSKKRFIREGDIVSLDCGAIVNGYHADSALTVPVGKVAPEVLQLIEKTEQSFWIGIEKAVAGNRLHDIGHAIQSYVESFGYGVVRELCGHGVGTHLHEDPQVPNYGVPGTGIRLRKGMTIAVEPMITLGSPRIYRGDDGWVIATTDGKPAAHYEHTILITDEKPIILTIPEEIKEGKSE